MSIQHIPQSEARLIKVAPQFAIREYGPLGEGVVNGTVAEVNGRYPDKGWGRNTVSDELVYVLSGTGALETPDGVQPLSTGDVAFVPKGQWIAWVGHELEIFIPCIPAWTAEQHEVRDGK